MPQMKILLMTISKYRMLGARTLAACCLTSSELATSRSKMLLYPQISTKSISKLRMSTNNDGKNNPSMFSIQESNTGVGEHSTATKNQYELVANETLESLTEKFDQLNDELNSLPADYDISYSSGVLTIKLGGRLGTYVINKQTPNLQIWLSSPISGPKRYDLVENKWLYKRTGECMHELLSIEISKLLNERVDFTECSYGPRGKKT
jgi:frataxin